MSSARSQLLQLLDDPDPNQRQIALLELQESATVDDLEPLVARLGDTDPIVRRLALEVLEELGDARALPAMIARLGDDDGTVRSSHAPASTAIFEAATAVLPTMSTPCQAPSPMSPYACIM